MSKDEVTQHEVEEWFDATTGDIHLRDAKRDLELDPSCYGSLRTIFSRLVTKGLAEHIRGKDGWYRKVQQDWEEINIFGDAEFYDLSWPFEDFRKYFRVARKGLVVIAGEQNAGKTGMCLNLAFDNCDRYDVWYFDSESGPDLLQERMFAIRPDLKPPLPFKLRVLEGSPEDIIKAHPDSMVILDYVEAPDDAWKVAGIEKRISESLRDGVAVVALQKPKGRDEAFGGSQVLNKPQVYLAMNSHSIKIVKAKSRVVKTINPVNMKWGFTLDNLGTQFTNIHRIYEEGEEPEEIPF